MADNYRLYFKKVQDPAILSNPTELQKAGVKITYESHLQGASRLLYWMYFIKTEKRIPNINALNAYPGQLQIGPAHEKIKAFLAETEPQLTGKTSAEVIAYLSTLAPPNVPPTMNYDSRTAEEEEFFDELVAYKKKSEEDNGDVILREWLAAPGVANITQEFLDFQSNSIDLNGKKVMLLLGNTLYPYNPYGYASRMFAALSNAVTYKQHYISALNEAGVNNDLYITNNMGKPIILTDPKTTSFDDLAISIAPHNVDIKVEWNILYVPSEATPFYVPLLHLPYIQESTPASETDFIVKPINQRVKREEQQKQYLSGLGAVCMQRPQFTLLITEPGRVRNLSGIIAWEVSRRPETKAAWAANYSEVVGSMAGLDDMEQLYMYEMQSALFESQPDPMRNDWWSQRLFVWLNEIKFESSALQAAQVRAMALVAAKSSLFKATEVQQKLEKVLALTPLTRIICDFKFIATPPVPDARENSLIRGGIPKLDKNTILPPLDNLNIAASELLRAQDYSRRVFTAPDIGVARLYTFNIPFFVFPHISEIPADAPDNRPIDRRLQYNQLFASATDSIKHATSKNPPINHAAFITDVSFFEKDPNKKAAAETAGYFARNLRAETNPDWSLFLTWFSSNFWRLAVSTSATANYRCAVFSHPNFLAKAFNRPSVAPGEVIPFSLILDRRSKPEGARITWYWEPVAAAASAVKPNSRSRLGPNLAAVAARAEADPNTAYNEFAALVPKYAVELVDARNTVASIKPRRKGFFGQSRNTYRRNLQGRIAKIRSTLRLNAVPSAAAVAGAAPTPPTRAQLLGNEIGRILAANPSANTMVKQLDALQPAYANVWPAANVAAVKAVPKKKRGFFSFGKNTAYEAGVRTTLRAMQQRLQKGGSRTRKNRRR